jgi:hypothetical protein
MRFRARLQLKPVAGFLIISLMAFGFAPSTVRAATQCLPSLATPADFQNVVNNRSSSFGIGDITSVVPLPDGRRFFTLGDTAYYNVNANGSQGPLTGFGNNSAWAQKGSCIGLLNRPAPGLRSWTLPPQVDGSVYWPGASVVVGARVYVFFTRLFLNSKFGTPVGAAVGVFDLPSLQLARLVPIPFFANRIFGNGAVYDDGYIYTYASQSRTCGFCFAADMYLARVPETQIQVPTAWQYRSEATWVRDERLAKPVLPDAVSNTDVQPYFNGYLLITKTDGIVGPDVEAWWSANPVGPWSDLGTVFQVPNPPPTFVAGFQYQQAFTYNVSVLAKTRLADGGFLGMYDVNSFANSDAQRDGRMVNPRFVSIHIPKPPAAPPRPVVAAGPSPWVPTFGVDRGGRVRTVAGGAVLNVSNTTRAVGVARTPTARGGWVTASDGGVFTFGDAHYYGSTGGLRLNQPIVGIAATPTGNGYWLVARDGGVFTFGDAHYHGSTGGLHLNEQIIGMAATPTGNGYWLVARDGGIFNFGDAHFFGSAGGHPPSAPVVSIAPTADGRGYRLATATGAVYTYGDAAFHGNSSSFASFVGIVSAPGGYRLVDSAGSVYAHGTNAGVTRIAGSTALVAAG